MSPGADGAGLRPVARHRGPRLHGMPSALPDGELAPADGSLPAHSLEQASGQPFSIYLHVPFCTVRCGYCDFNTYTSSELDGMGIGDYVADALAELDLAARVLDGRTGPASTVFIGGGTPSLLSGEQYAALIDGVRTRFGLTPDAEVTTEANPESTTPALLEAMLAAGVNRLSLGMQSARPHVLAVLDRKHTPGRALEVVRAARTVGFADISLDLIMGTPGESVDDWEASLDGALEADIDHLSAYSLIVEDGTALARRVRRGELPMPDEDDLADKYLLTEQRLVGAGFENYEVSNWARPDAGSLHRSRHNLAYWRSTNWWGIGPGAHSHVSGTRWWNVKHPRRYGALLGEGASPSAGRELLSDEQRRVERVLLELRIADGLGLEVLTDSERGRVPDLISRGLATRDDQRLRLTLQGRLLADAVIRDLLD